MNGKRLALWLTDIPVSPRYLAAFFLALFGYLIASLVR